MWDKLMKAVNSVISGDATRVDNDLFTVYNVGSNVIRIDLKANEIRDAWSSGQDIGYAIDDELVVR